MTFPFELSTSSSFSFIYVLLMFVIFCFFGLSVRNICYNVCVKNSNVTYMALEMTTNRFFLLLLYMYVDFPIDFSHDFFGLLYLRKFIIFFNHIEYIYTLYDKFISNNFSYWEFFIKCIQIQNLFFSFLLSAIYRYFAYFLMVVNLKVYTYFNSFFLLLVLINYHVFNTKILKRIIFILIF